MRHAFLSDAWFARVDELVAAAPDLEIPAAMRQVELNVTVAGPAGETKLSLKNGLFARGHLPGATTTLTLGVDLARRIFVDADAAAGVQAFLNGEIKVEGDLAKLVAMQTTPPTPSQIQLGQEIAKITA